MTEGGNYPEYIPSAEPGETGPLDEIITDPQNPLSQNLIPFQYQLGSFVFGYRTNVPVNDIQIQSYNVNVQDFQVIRTDERSFGIDTLAPGNLTFKMAVLDNYPLPNMLHLTDSEIPPSLVARQGVLLPALAKEWKANEVRPIWGETKPIYFCDSDGIVRRIYGRPGKFQFSRRNRKNAWFDVQCEYRRADTYAYSDIEYYVGPVAPNAPAVMAQRLGENGDAWFRILLFGPFTNPIITWGGSTIELNATIADGVVLEISSYPWERRCIDSNGLNWRAALIGETVYLDQLVFPADTYMPISWTVQEGTETNADSRLIFLWRENTHVI